MKKVVLPLILFLLVFVSVANPQAPAPSFQAGESGLPIVWYPNLPNVPNPVLLYGSTVTLIIKSFTNVPQEHSVICAVGGDGLSAQYTMVATDFPNSGAYQLQFIATFSSSVVRKSPIQQIQVGQSLD